jgi:hypothetical protein
MMTLTFLLGLVLSTVGMIGGPVLLCVCGAWLFWRGFTHLALVAVIAAGVWISGGLLYQQGVAACEARTKVAYEAGLADQKAANDAADAFQRGYIAGTLALQRDITTTIKENEDEAAADPAAADCGMSLDGVRRYEKLRRRSH